MFVRKFAIAIVCCTATVLLASCSYNSVNTKSAKSSDQSFSAKATRSVQVSQPAKPDFAADVESQASLYKTTPGKVALSMLICKLSNSYAYSDLVKKSAKELLNIVNEAAVERSTTLESLDSRYELSRILASEKIYVSIESNEVNTVTSSDGSAYDSDQATYSARGTESSDNPTQWIAKFQKAIRQPFSQQ